MAPGFPACRDNPVTNAIHEPRDLLVVQLAFDKTADGDVHKSRQAGEIDPTGRELIHTSLFPVVKAIRDGTISVFARRRTITPYCVRGRPASDRVILRPPDSFPLASLHRAGDRRAPAAPSSPHRAGSARCQHWS